MTIHLHIRVLRKKNNGKLEVKEICPYIIFSICSIQSSSHLIISEYASPEEEENTSFTHTSIHK